MIRFISQHRMIAIAAGVVVVFAGAFLIWRGLQPSKPGVQTLPLQGNGSTTTGSISNLGGGIVQTSIRLSEGQAQPQAVTPITLASGTPLSPDEIKQILSRLPALPVDPSAQVDFKLPANPIPPPRPGATITQPFPPASVDGPATPVASGPLEVLRFSPEGEIPIAPFIDITFNQPMVPLTTIPSLAASQAPVQVEPPLPGTWRWLGTRTLNFQYDSTLIDRLPKATSYRVTIPAGTTSATGGVLAKAVEWGFSTPPPKVTLTYPENGPQSRTPLFFIHFDQRINQADVLQTIRVTAGGQPASLELVSEAIIKADEKQNYLLKDAKEGRWVAFQAKEPLPADADVSVVISPGTPSAEGPLLTKDAQSYAFRTYAALRIEDHGCGYGNNQCPPLSPFSIQFNNPIDDSLYTDPMLRIDPQLPGAVVNIFGKTIAIQGATKGQTTYTVTVSKDIQDTFGQKLGQDTQLTFQVGQADPMLSGPQGSFLTLDPAAKKPVFSVYTMNLNSLDVEIYAVQPSDWINFKSFFRNFQQSNALATPPGRQVLNKSLPVESPADTLNEVDIDLASVMDGAFGHFIVLVSPSQSLIKSDPNRYWQKVVAWVQVTQIGLDAFNDHSDMVVWASALKNGAPLPGVTITAGPVGGQVAATAQDGAARLPIPNGASYLVAAQGPDQAILPHDPYPGSDQGWTTSPVTDELRWYVFDDRQMYRPGEEVHFKGWLRRIGGGQNGDVGLVGSLVNAVSYQITDSQGNALGSGRVDVNALGGFDLAFKLPDSVNLGYTSLSLNVEGNLGALSDQKYSHSFQIQEFRTPEFEVTARNESAGPYFAGGQAVVAVDAKYYAGGALPNADVTWQVTSTPGQYSPPNWPDFTFGTWTPWWETYNFGFGGRIVPGGGGESKVETFSGKTDANGTHYLQLNIDSLGGLKPVSVIAEASVMDVNRQSWSSSTTLLVHPASLYVGLRSDKMFVDRGTPLKVDFIVTDLDGKPVVDRPVEVGAARLEWKYQSGSWQEVEADVQTCSKGSQTAPVTCEFNTPLGGTYRITATVSDEHGRQNQSQFTRWVSGGKLPPARTVTQEQVTLIPDKQTYQPGDVAQILVQAPFGSAEGLLTVGRNGILSTQRFTIQDTTITLKVPIDEKSIPDLNLQVDLNGSAPRTGDQGEALPDVAPRPAYATGQLTLSVPPQQRTLAVAVSPAQPELEPGGATTLNVSVKDAAGRPVSGAEVTVVVVDEAILALSNYQSPDPLNTFYTSSPSGVSSIYGRASIVLANPQALAGQVAGAKNGAREALQAAPAATSAAAAAPAPGQPPSFGAAPADHAAPPPIRVRTDFNPLAMFAAAEHTAASGDVQVTVKLPDNLTRYRVMVVAVDQSGKQFGQADSNLVARLPLMVRPSAPRFLNFGDTFELPVVLQNQTDQPMTVDVAVRGTNVLLTGSQGIRVTVPARDRVEVRFPAAAQMAGTARLQIAAVSSAAADAATVELPVYTPATSEAFATYGVIDAGAVAQPVAAPSGVFPQYGGLEITTSSTALQALTDAVLYLQSYPYEFSEQLSSRILAVAALRDVLTAFQAKGLPSPAEMESAVERDITLLQSLQNDDGGFPYWEKGKESIPFNTIHAAHALYQAGAKGFTVPADMQQRALEYLRQVENHYPAWYDQHTRQTLSAYALYVRSLSGDRDPQKALKLLNDAGLENQPMEAIGWLWPVLKDAPGAGAQLEAIRQFVNNHTVETAGAANFTTSYDEQTYLLLSSDRRTDAILLDALIGDNPQSDLIPKVVNGLLAHRTQGRWGSTQENVFVLLALDHYFNTFEAQTPDFVAQIWLGPTYAGSQQFSGRTTDRNQTNIPMSYLVDPSLGGGGTQDLVLSKDGSGRLYYRLGLTYAPTDLNLKPLDMGFVVTRVYEAVDNPTDVTQDQDGVWHIKAGARVRVHLTMVADNRRYHVALTDPLPAGLEIINPALAVSGSTPQDPNSPDYRYGWWWWGTWYEHQNLQEERAEAFTSLLWDGVYQYTYTARATTPGRFVVPPAKAEEMYSPEVFGRSGSNIVIVQ
ncbi:MAG TPA: Ig-like domain-containing protein [Anaerolineaceae bacterium]